MAEGFFLPKGRVFLFFIFVFLFLDHVLVFSQVEGTIYDAASDFIFVSNGKRTVSRLENANGMIIRKSDMVQTGEGGNLEIAFSGGAARVFVRESTSFAYNGIEEGGALSLKLLYGRLRVKNVGGREARIQAGDASASVADGDFGFDFTVEPSWAGKPVFRVYRFAGKGNVSLLNAGEDMPKMAVNEYETVSVALFSKNFVVRRDKISAENLNSWNKNNFKGAESLSLPEEKKVEKVETTKPDYPVTTMETQIRYIQPDYSPYYKANRIKNIAIIMGTFFVAGGAALEGLSGYYALNDNPDMAKTLSGAGYGPLGVGMLALLGAILYNPRFVPPPKE